MSQVPPPVPKKPSILLLPTSVQSSSNGSTDRQMLQVDSPVGLQSPVGAFLPEDILSPNVPHMPYEDENHLGTDEESSKESSLQSSLQDSSLTELEGKMSSTGIGAGTSMEILFVRHHCAFLIAIYFSVHFLIYFVYALCLYWTSSTCRSFLL